MVWCRNIHSTTITPGNPTGKCQNRPRGEDHTTMQVLMLTGYEWHNPVLVMVSFGRIHTWMPVVINGLLLDLHHFLW